MNTGAPGIENSEVKLAKQILLALNGTFKKLSLYFENHSIYQEALNLLKKTFDEYFRTHAEIRFDIFRNQIRFGEDIIHQGKMELNELFYILFRDGVLWISFQSGMELWELDTFYKIVHKHMVLEDNAEDDVVTALWEFNLHGILYEAADLDLGTIDVLDDAQAECRPDADDPEPEEEQSRDDVSLPLNEQDDIWQLTADERETIRKMVAEEEKLDGTDHVIDVLFYILRQLRKPGKDIDEVLESLTQELREAALSGRFAYFRNVLKKLKQHKQDMETARHWSAPYLKDFFADLSGPEFLNVLPGIASQVEECEPEEITVLKQALLLLGASAVPTLAPMLMEMKTTKMYQLLLSTIATMSAHDFSYLRKLLNSSPPELVRRLVIILRHLNDRPSRQALSLLLAHESEAVRKEALKAVLARDGQSLEEVFALIDDPDKSIRTLLLKHLGKERNPRTEALLLDYLAGQQSEQVNDGDLYEVSETLGRCGSDVCIAYLEKELFKWPALGILRSSRSTRRRAALVALKSLNTPRAAALAAREARGFFGNILRRPSADEIR